MAIHCGEHVGCSVAWEYNHRVSRGLVGVVEDDRWGKVGVRCMLNRDGVSWESDDGDYTDVCDAWVFFLHYYITLNILSR